VQGETNPKEMAAFPSPERILLRTSLLDCAPSIATVALWNERHLSNHTSLVGT
jgi:hypothetical protein